MPRQFEITRRDEDTKAVTAHADLAIARETADPAQRKRAAGLEIIFHQRGVNTGLFKKINFYSCRKAA